MGDNPVWLLTIDPSRDNYIMTTKETVPYFQIPKILMKHSGTTPSHATVFAYLYDMLRQEPYCRTGYNKTNSVIAENSLVGLRQTKRILNDLEEWGFLTRTGMTINRKFYLGDKFTTSDKSEPNQKLTSDKSEPNKGHIGTLTSDKSELHSKNSFKNLYKDTKMIFSQNSNSTSSPKNQGLTILELQEKAYYEKNPHVQIKEEHKYLFGD